MIPVVVVTVVMREEDTGYAQGLKDEIEAILKGDEMQGAVRVFHMKAPV